MCIIGTQLISKRREGNFFLQNLTTKKDLATKLNNNYKLT